MATVLLILVAAYTAAIVWRGKTFRPRLLRTLGGSSRARVLQGWGWGLIVSFGLPAAIGLLMIEVHPLSPGLPALLGIWPEDWGYVPPEPLMAGMAIGTVANAGITYWRARRGRRAFSIGNFPDVGPERRGELIPAIWLSICAGVCEELFFRLLVPLLIARVFGNAWAAVAASALMFGAVHRYQGWRGVVATALVGLGLSLLFAATGLFWVPVAFHVVIDLNALVVRPIVRGAWRRGD